MRRNLAIALVVSCVCLRGWQGAREQIGKFVQSQTPGLMPGRYQTMADMTRALLTSNEIFAAYCRAPLLNPPRGFDLIHNANADARNTPRGWPIPVGSEFILIAYDGSKRLPNGRFATEGEGPVLGGFQMNSIDCGTPPADNDFYYMPKQTDTVHGWPQFGGVVFMTKRTQPRWLPVSTERALKVQIERAHKTNQDVNDTSPRSTYAKWMSGKEKRLRDYQNARDEMAKALGKQKADAYLATMLETEKKTEAMFAAMAQQGINATQGQVAKTLNDLEAQLNSLSADQRQAPAYVYESADGAFSVGHVVPDGTPGAVAVVYPNPNFYDRSLPAWEAQSVCVSLSTGPVSQGHFLYPTIQNIWKSLDWDAIAQVLK